MYSRLMEGLRWMALLRNVFHGGLLTSKGTHTQSGGGGHRNGGEAPEGQGS